MSEFNPRSHDAMFAQILQKLEDMQGDAAKTAADTKECLESIMAKQDLTNGKVKGLLEWKAELMGKIWGITATVSVVMSGLGWVLSHFL